MSFKWNEDKHTYELSQFSSVAAAKRHLDLVANVELTIQSDADYEIVKNNRKEINRLVKELSTSRKQMTAIVLGTFAPQCIAIEKHGTKLGDELTKKMDAWKPKEKKEKVFKLEIKSTDINALKKIEKMALKYSCEVSMDI